MNNFLNMCLSAEIKHRDLNLVTEGCRHTHVYPFITIIINIIGIKKNKHMLRRDSDGRYSHSHQLDFKLD